MKVHAPALRGFFLAALTSGCLHAQAPQSPTPSAAPATTITFPRDLYDHQAEQAEWWYYTGNLRSLTGKQYGFELTFFRSFKPTGAPAGQPQAIPIIFSDLAISDLDGQRHFFHKQVDLLPSANAGITEQPWSIREGTWQLNQPSSAQGFFHLLATQDDFGLDLYMLPESLPVLHGTDGLFILDGSDGQGNESFEYYSYPRVLTAGLLRVNGEIFPVEGLSWNDHEFFSLSPGQTFPSWDWFSIQLKDKSSIMLYGLRLPDGRFDPASIGTYVDPNGKVTHLLAGDYTLKPGETWHSAVSGADYPIAWTIDIPRLNLQLEMSTPLLDQEMPAVPGGASPTYWEGASRYTGTKAGRPISGKGYLEMLGYNTR